MFLKLSLSSVVRFGMRPGCIVNECSYGGRGGYLLNVLFFFFYIKPVLYSHPAYFCQLSYRSHVRTVVKMTFMSFVTVSVQHAQ